MTQLLSIETAFLSLPAVKQGLNLQEIKTTLRSEANAQKQKFAQSLKLGKLAVAAEDWLNSTEGLAICAEEGITWNKEMLGAKLFGWQKSYTCKVIKAGRLAEDVVAAFEAKCEQMAANRENPKRSIEALLAFAKQIEQGSSESESGEGESESGEEAEVRTNPTCVVTFSVKRDPNNIAFRIMSDGTIKTTNSQADLLTALNALISVISNESL